jgi:asparagine synthase (glutamine-hydrolysing)
MPVEQKLDLFSDDVNDQIMNDEKTLSIISDIFTLTKNISSYDRVLHFFEKIHLDCLLERLDMMSMAASVEARVPFVDDHELVEFVTQIPFKYKMLWKSKLHKLKAIYNSSSNASEVLDINKYILRKVGSKMLPNSIAYRKKLGFPTPLDDWFKTGLIDYAREILLDQVAINRNLFKKDKMEKFLKNNENLPYDFYGKKIWMLMNIELWYQNVCD